MKHSLSSLFSLFSLAACTGLFPGSLHAQAPTTAKPSLIKDLQVGIAFTSANPDVAQKRISGFSAYATVDFTRHLGLEVDLHDPNVTTPDDFLEKSYLVGLRYVYRFHRLQPYARAMVGIGQTSVDLAGLRYPGTPGNYGLYAFGGGLDLALTRHLNLRAIDFEVQRWSSFQPNGLSPSLVSIGLAYRFR